jgi:hypothetical protein
MSTRFELGLAGSPDTQPVSVTNPIPVVNGGVTTSTLNSTTAVLAGGAVFTGTAENISGYADVRISVIASHASATDGLQYQQSIDGTNWDFVDSYTVAAASGKALGFPVNGTWGRVVYTNGATLQTSFRLQTRYLPAHNKSSSVRPQDARSNENDMEENLAYGMLWNGASWDRAKAAPYQTAQTPIIGKSGNVANASAAATLTGTATTTVYLAGFEVSGSGSTVGLPVTVTVAGLLGGTIQYTYSFQAGALIANTPLIVEFNPPLPASAVNTPIVVTCPAGGTGATNNTVTAHGFFQ